MKMYVITKNPNFDEDYIQIFTTIKKAAEKIAEIALEEGIFIEEKEIVKTAKAREKEHAVYAFIAEENKDKFDIRLKIVKVEE